jgi:Trypsin-like peptidase domain
MRLGTLLMLSLIVLVTSGSPGSGQPVSATQIDAVAKSVLKITASQCQTDDRTATGFIWQDANNAVTAWHVVTGCSRLIVYYQAAKVSRPAHVVKLRRESDLVLLSIDNAPNVPVLAAETAAVAVNTDLATLGFPLQTENMSSTRLDLRYGGGKLRDIVTDSTLQGHITDLGFPSLDLEIAPIEGHLLPGLSGAPIFDRAGKVVAIGDGGLENGVAGISWGVPVSELHGLVTSPEAVGQHAAGTTNSVIKAAGLFASESEASVKGKLTCSGIELTKIRTASFSQIAASTDDAVGLQQIVNYFNVNPSGFSFDVYQHLPSGATVVIPSNVSLTSDTKGCTASSSNGDIVMRVELGIVNSDAEVQSESQQFESDAVNGAIQGWNPDPSFSYFAPKGRFDGMFVVRKGFVHLNAQLIAPSTFPQDRYLFETVATRKHVVITETVLNNVATVQNNQLGIACRLNPVAPNCSGINARSDDWVRSVIAVQLATFPIG